MEHPFAGDLSALSIEELTEKINSLGKNLSFASRMGRYDLMNQVRMLMESYRSELNRQQQLLLDDDETLTGKIDIS